MPSTLPEGDPAPPTGELPAAALASLPDRPLGIYLHVPFCTVRCGYCDFNTYAVSELGGGLIRGATVSTFADAALAELDLAAQVLGPGAPPAHTVFVGGGTPTLLSADDLARLLDGVRDRWGLAPDVEVTTEANPDTVGAAAMIRLAKAGFTRVSLGMQSAVTHVLRTLDRTHDPAGVATAVEAVRAAGMQVSLDLIYGTPGESFEDWRVSLETAMALEPEHISAYALTVEPGTKLANLVKRRMLLAPEDDDEAQKYLMADDLLRANGFGWYEVSNWARSRSARCQHNLGYWRSHNWWGVGPGAHSHVGGVRWWNVKHPVAYAERLAAAVSPAQAREVLTEDQSYAERVMLGIRLVEGLPVGQLRPEAVRQVAGLIADGFIDGRAAVIERTLRLTQQGRLLADNVVHRLT